MIHQLKCREDYFDDIYRGKKKFEVRKKDRPFQVGDFIALNEIELGNDNETGRSLLLKITYILDSKEFCKDGYVILSFDYCGVTTFEQYAPPILTR